MYITPFIIFQSSHLITCVEFCEVGDIPDEGEDDNWHYIDCAGQTCEPAKNSFQRYSRDAKRIKRTKRIKKIKRYQETRIENISRWTGL